MTAALSGLRVIEYGDMVSAPYAGKLFADLGADVIKVEPPGGDTSRRRGPFPAGMEGDPDASGLFLYLNTNKRGVTLDLSQAAERETFLRLLDTADVLIQNHSRNESEALGIAYDQVAERFPKLVYTWVTPFGLSGPHADWEAENITVVSAGGWASVTPGSSPYADLPPLLAAGQQAQFQAALHSAVATMGALFARRGTGTGQLVEVSAQECIAAALELAFVTYSYTGRIASRLGVRTSAPMEIIECSDGLIFVMTADPHQWTSFVKMMGDPEWAHLEVFDDRFKRGQNRDALRPFLEDFLGQHTVMEAFDMAGEARLPFAPVSNVGDLLSSPHLKSRGFFAQVRTPKSGEITMPGAPYIMPETPWAIRRPAPTLGQANHEILDPLRGVPA